MKTITGLSAIARRLQTDGYQKINTADMRRIIIDIGLGHDPRTARSWTQAAVFLGLLVVEGRTPKGGSLYLRGPEFGKFLAKDNPVSDDQTAQKVPGGEVVRA
jgi:hypothetical protein